jgi:hypothetical protein
MIIGLGQLAVEQSYNGTAKWGDVMTDSVFVQRDAIKRVENSVERLYQDMADEPGKYGDDIFGWSALEPNREFAESYWSLRQEREQDDETRANAGNIAEQNRWRKIYTKIAHQAGALGIKRWINLDIKRIKAEVKASIAKKNKDKANKISATKLQALVRGYQARCKNVHLDCCMCLSHSISPLKTDVGYMCRACAVDGPHVDIVRDDPWSWYRAEFIC